MTRAKPRAKAKRRVKSERKAAATSEAASLQADAVSTPGLTLERPAAVPPDETIRTMPPLSAETHDADDSITGDNEEQTMHEVDESNNSAGAVDATTHEDSAPHHAKTLLTTTTTAAEDTERALQPSDNASSETDAMALAIGRLKAQLTAPFMLYDHNTHSIVPNPLYQRGAALRRALIASQSTLLHILREARAQAAQLTPKELLYHMQRAVLYICAQGLSLTSDMVTTTTTSTSSPDTTSATSSELGGALDGLWCMSSDATVAGQLPALESALARRDASAIAVLVTSAALSEGGGQEELQRYMAFLRARLSEEQDPAMQSKRSAEERAALQATVNNVNDMATLQSALSVAYKSIQPSQPLQLSGTESQGTTCGATMSAEANARSVALLLQGYYNVLQWVLAVERDRAALRQSRVGVSDKDEVTAALPTLQSRVEEYDPFTGRLVLKRTTPQSPWGLLTNMQGCLIGIENTLRNASPAGEQLYHVLQSAAPPPSAMTSSASLVSGATHNNNNTAVVTSSSDYGFPILQANRRRIRPPQLTQAELQAQQYDIVRRLCDSLAQPETTLHLVIQKRSQAELTAAHEVLFELAAQGAEQSAGQRVVLILQRALTSIPWGITLDYQSGSPALLTDFSSKLQLSDRAKNFLFDRRGQLRVLQINYVDTRRLPSASAMQELLAHSLLLALQLQVVAPASQHNVTNGNNNISAAATSNAVAAPVAGRGASLAKADTSNTPPSSSSSAATTTAPSLDAAADAIMKEMLAARHNSQAAVSTTKATAATQAPSLPHATHDAPAKELTAAGEDDAVTAAEQTKKLSSKRTPRANATTATSAESEDVAHDDRHAAVLEGHEWAAIPSTPPSRQAEGPTRALQVSSSAVKGSSRTKSSSNDSNGANDSVNEEDARHRELLEEYGIADPSDDPPQQAQVNNSDVAVTQTGQTDAVTDVDALTADVLAEAERSPSLDDADEDEPTTKRRQKAAKAAKKAKAAKNTLPEEIEGGGDAMKIAEEEMGAATASLDKSTRKSAKKEKAKKGKAKKKKSKQERKSKTSKQAEAAEEDETSNHDNDEADDEANEVTEEAADGVEAHTTDAAASGTKVTGALPQQADAETDKQLETRDATVATKSQREKPAKQTRGKVSRRAVGETATPVALTQREFAGEVAALLREMPTDHTDNNKDSSNGANVKETTSGGGGDALGATPLVASKSTAEVALEVAVSNSKTKKKKASSSNEGTTETSVTPTATLPEPSLVELVEATPLTFDNAVQLTSFDGAEAHFHRTQTSQPWEIKLAFEHNDLYVTQLPPANTATTRRHPFLRYLKPDAKGAGKWMVEQVNGTNVLEMTKEQKAPFVNMLRKATDVRFVLRALKR